MPCKLFGYVEDLCTNVEWQVHASFGDRIIRSNPRISIGAAVRTTEGRDVGQSSLCITNWKNTKAKWYDNEEGKLRTGQWLVLLAGIPFIAGVAVMMVGLSLVHYSFTKQPKPITVTFK
ncbi:hypothetical protein Pelo_11236 [Pelomyxa schiedti]|nr:hypothetical protein Pelo_11236 [Pelomyxa schiedti]